MDLNLTVPHCVGFPQFPRVIGIRTGMLHQSRFVSHSY